MRRFAPIERGVVTPQLPIKAGEVRSLWSQTQLTAVSGETFISACLACPDQKCAKYTDSELSKVARLASPFAPDPVVCPTSAINPGDDGIMAIAEESCMGCGLCVVRCPVGAIHLDRLSSAARVARPSSPHYALRRMSTDEFETYRANLAGKIPSESAPFHDAFRVQAQMRRALQIFESAAGQKVLRLLARNMFLIGGAAARLKNVGDNNAAVELLVDGGNELLIIEVEPSTDVLDAVRRVVAGSAIAIARLGADRSILSTAVVVPKLPNERVEFYRVAQNVHDRLGLTVYGFPLALILLAVRSRGGGLATNLQDYCNANGSVNVTAVQRAFGNLRDLSLLGLVALK